MSKKKIREFSTATDFPRASRELYKHIGMHISIDSTVLPTYCTWANLNFSGRSRAIARSRKPARSLPTRCWYNLWLCARPEELIRTGTGTDDKWLAESVPILHVYRTIPSSRGLVKKIEKKISHKKYIKKKKK